jgi:DNA-binding NarL/FixJ family response regulator
VDVLLLDLRMPGRDGISALEELVARGSTVPVLVLTTFDDVEPVLGAVRAGARGYLLKDVTLDQLTGAIRTPASGGTALQPALTDRIVRAAPAPRRSTQDPVLPEPLTPRERDMLRLAAGDYSNAEIATALHLAPGTAMAAVLHRGAAWSGTSSIAASPDRRCAGRPVCASRRGREGYQDGPGRVPFESHSP